MFLLLVSMGYTQASPPTLVSGMIVGYNTPNIDVIIRDTNTGLTINTVTNNYGEFHYDMNAHSNWNCNDNIQINILGIIESGFMECTSSGAVLGYKDAKTGLVYAKFDFSGSCPSCEICLECPEFPECPVCDCDEGILSTIIKVILSCMVGAGIGLSIRRDSNGDLKFSIRSHRHQGRNYLHSIYRIHRAPYTHKHGEVMPVYKQKSGDWYYVEEKDR